MLVKETVAVLFPLILKHFYPTGAPLKWRHTAPLRVEAVAESLNDLQTSFFDVDSLNLRKIPHAPTYDLPITDSDALSLS